MALFEINQISKQFGNVEVLRDVSFSLERGTILGLVGENGSGKSTCMNIIGGIHRASGGSMRLEDTVYAPHGPGDATDAGIAFIHQELNLFENLSIEENLFIGAYPTLAKFLPIIDRKTIRRRTQELLDAVDIGHPPNWPVSRLSPGERQLVEIAKALSFKARIIILDEPTTSLTSQEADRLFGILERLRSQGVAMIYISHALDDVLRLCDEVHVLRDGNLVGGGATTDLTQDGIIEWMVGRKIEQLFPEREFAVRDEVLLEIDGVSCPGFVKDVSLRIHRGEVVGIAGLMGSGRTELARILFGLDPMRKGRLLFGGNLIDRSSPRKSLDLGMAFLTEDRRLEGLMMPAPVVRNIALASLWDYTLRITQCIRHKKLRLACLDEAKRVNVKAEDYRRLAVMHLSGGNQQKVVLAKWLLRQPALFILDEPTRGIDVGAKYEIYSLINDLVSRGAGILMISSEVEELVGMSDRILVMNNGEICAEHERANFNSQHIMDAAIRSRATERN